MRIIDLLDKKSIQLNAVASGKKDVLDQAVTLMGQSGKIRDIEKYRRGVYKREEESTTGIGEGIATVDGKLAAKGEFTFAVV